MNKIYRTKWGQYIDLSYIISISRIYRGEYGENTRFDIELIFRDKPMIFDFLDEPKETTIIYYNDLLNAWIKYKNGTDEQPK